MWSDIPTDTVNTVGRTLCLQVRLVYSKVCSPMPPGIMLPPEEWVGRASIHSDFNNVLKFYLKMIYFTPCCSLCSKSNHCKLKSDFGSPHYNSSWRLRASFSGFKQEAMEFFLQGERQATGLKAMPSAILKVHDSPRKAKPCAGGGSLGRLHGFKSPLPIILVSSKCLLNACCFPALWCCLSASGLGNDIPFSCCGSPSPHLSSTLVHLEPPIQNESTPVCDLHRDVTWNPHSGDPV